MIRLHATHDGEKHTLVIEGHADAAPHGYDIVCAAVSAIYQTALLGLAVVAKQHPSLVTFEGEELITDRAAGSAHHIDS